MRWLNEPRDWSGDASDLTVAVEPGADGWYSIRAVRGPDAVQILCGDQPVRLAPLAAGDIMSGPMSAAPEGPGFTARFRAL